jgi:acetolactate synthase regulatory subunit
MTETIAPPSRDGTFPLHVIAIELQDRPGSVNSVAEVFSGRGLQIEELHGSAEHLNADGHAHALIAFRASADRASLVTRVLRRLSSVRRAELLADDDARLLQSALIARPGDETRIPADVRIAAIDAHTALASGTPAALRRWLASGEPPQLRGTLRLDLRADT